ncbi:hypothetical protein ACFL4L_02440, partial [bacterium]
TFIGLLFCLLQQKYGFISVKLDFFISEELPVKIIFNDLWKIWIASFIICILSAAIPAFQAGQLLPMNTINQK